MQEPFSASLRSLENVYLEVQKPKNKKTALLTVLQQMQNGIAVVTCFSSGTVQELTESLTKEAITCFYKDPSLKERECNVLYKELKTHTSAVLFVLDKDFGALPLTVSLLVHYNMPISLEDYYTQVAQAAVNSQGLQAILFYSSKDIMIARTYMKELPKPKNASAEELEQFHEAESLRLKVIIQYCHTEGCLQAFIGQAFNEEALTYCGNCGNCDNNFEQTDIADTARIILTCIFRLGKLCSEKILIEILRGSHSEAVQANTYDHMPVFGLLKELKENQLQDIFTFLTDEGYLTFLEKPSAGYALTEKANDILQANDELIMPVKKEQQALENKTYSTASSPEKLALLNKLRSARSALARGASVPTYGILPDASLREMVQKMPRTKTDLIDITGFTETKRKQYGDAFLEVILAHMKNS